MTNCDCCEYQVYCISLEDKYRMNMTSSVRAGRRGGRFKTAGSAFGVELRSGLAVHLEYR